MRDMRIRLQWLGVLFFAVFALAVNLRAQYGTANLVGTVTDPSGAVIPGVKVTVTEPTKGFSRDLVTDSTGNFAISNIPIGTYTIAFEAKGFQKIVQTDVTLITGQTQRVNAALKVGAVTQEVTVQGNVPHVQTETAAISGVVTSQQLSQISINGRDFVRLALLVPGAVPTDGLNTTTVGVYANNSISFNGSRTQYNNWTVDGAPNTDEGSAGTFNTYPNLDSIAEFRISTSNYGAEYGKHSGAQIDVVTKSGTKQFHGDVAEYLRNDVLDGENFFTNRGDLTGTPPKRAPLKQNEYGFTIGGPFFIPGIYNTSKSKTFFFYSEDWRKIRGSNVLNHNVPSLLERKGDFSQCDKAGTGVGNDAPYDKVVAAGCVLPVVNGVTYDNLASIPGWNPNSQAVVNANDFLAAYIPTPNEGAASPIGWTKAAPAATNWREDQIRVDQNIGDKTRVFVRYTHDAWNTVVVPTLWGGSNFDTVQTGFNGPGKSAAANITSTFSPTLMNEFVAGYTEDWITLTNLPGGSSTGITRPSSFALAHFFPANGGNPLLPGMQTSGGGPGVYEAAYSANPWTNSNPIVNFADNMTKVHGNHVLKFGMYLQDYHKNETFGAATQGFVLFSTSNANTSGNGFADMFLGQARSYNEGTETSVSGVPVGGNSKGHWQNWDFEPYFEDDWHVSPKLTLNLGLRYYLLTHIHDITKPTVDSGFLPQLYSLAAEAQYDKNGKLIQGTGATPLAYGNGLVECGTGGIPPGCQTNTYNNWAPRFGFAYRLGQNTSIRGGYGIFYEVGNGNEAESEGGEGNPPHELSLTSFNLAESGLGPIYTNGQYSAPIPPAGYTLWPYRQKWPSEQQYSLSFEHQFASDNLFSFAWVGEVGHHLAAGYPFNMVRLGQGTVNVPQLAGANKYCDAMGNCDVQNFLINNAGNQVFFQPYRGYSGMSSKQDTANSNYNALQAEFRHTFGRGLTTQVSYTWSHNLDDTTSTYTQSDINTDPYDQKRWYGTSSNNRTHVFTASYIYNLPFFNNAGNALVRQSLGGWEISGVTTLMTGQPVDFNCGLNGHSSGIGGGVRCNTLGHLAIQKGIYNDPTYGPTVQWYNPGLTAQPLLSQFYANGQAGMFGYMGRYALTGPGVSDTDLSLMKNWKVSKFGEGGGVQFRWETFNTFNHVNWTGISTGCSGKDTFGQPCNSPVNDIGRGDVTRARDPRIMQFALTVKW